MPQVSEKHITFRNVIIYTKTHRDIFRCRKTTTFIMQSVLCLLCRLHHPNRCNCFHKNSFSQSSQAHAFVQDSPFLKQTQSGSSLHLRLCPHFAKASMTSGTAGLRHLMGTFYHLHFPIHAAMAKEAMKCVLVLTFTPWLYNLLSTNEVEMGLTLEVNSLLPFLLIGIAPIVILP